MSARTDHGFSSFALTHVGKVRDRNEDAFTCRDEAGLWAVADGMGGHEAGDRASKTVIEALNTLEKSDGQGQQLTRAIEALRQANQQLIQLGDRLQTRLGPASTVAILLVKGRRGTVLWAGDSRIYRLRGEEVQQLTHDHSHIQDLIDREELDPEDAESHPLAHMITRAVGIRDALNPETREFDVHGGDRFLLCTDGLSRLLSAQEIACFSLGEKPEQWLRAMMDVALEHGAPDNVTMVAVDVHED